MTVAAADLLTEATVPRYLEDRWDDISRALQVDLEAPSAMEGVTVTAIQGGNLNYAFCVTFPNLKGGGNGKRTLFLKQAPEFVAVFGPDGYPLTSERMQREMDVYAEWKALLGDELTSRYLPEIYYFDKSHMVVVMEFLDGFTLLDHVLVASGSSHHAEVAASLGDFMGRIHAATHVSKVGADRAAYLTRHYENREMRDVQLEFVFTKCYKEATDEQRAGLNLTPEFMKEVETLRDQYDGKAGASLVLTHGDLHAGSVMVDPHGHAKVIDPEFTIYGPPGLDVGSLLSGYCLGAIHQAYSDDPDAAEKIVDGAGVVWEAYSRAMAEGGLVDKLPEIEVETVGFAVAEVCRTALEFAGGRKWLQFDDAGTKAAARRAALQVVDRCMVARHTGGMGLLLEEMKTASVRKA